MANSILKVIFFVAVIGLNLFSKESIELKEGVDIYTLKTWGEKEVELSFWWSYSGKNIWLYSDNATTTIANSKTNRSSNIDILDLEFDSNTKEPIYIDDLVILRDGKSSLLFALKILDIKNGTLKAELDLLKEYKNGYKYLLNPLDGVCTIFHIEALMPKEWIACQEAQYKAQTLGDYGAKSNEQDTLIDHISTLPSGWNLVGSSNSEDISIFANVESIESIIKYNAQNSSWQIYDGKNIEIEEKSGEKIISPYDGFWLFKK